MPLNALRGLIPATITPFRSDESLDVDSLRRYLAWLGGFDLGGVVMHADSGEVHALSNDERTEITAVTAEVLGGRIPVIAGLAAQSTTSAVAEGKRLKDAGADAFLVFPPMAFYGKPLPADLPERYYKTIADEVGLPLVAFQLLDALGGVEYSPDALRRILAIEHVVAIKEASFDAMKFRTTLGVARDLPRRISLLTGNDPFIYESLLMGSDGCLIGFGTVAVAQQVEMIEAVKTRDYDRAEKLVEAVRPLNETVFGSPVRNYRARLKTVLAELDVIDTDHVRGPLVRTAEIEKPALIDAYSRVGMFSTSKNALD
jgi:4-hydroxy-tetrahydrodipicolinate synthase